MPVSVPIRSVVAATSTVIPAEDLTAEIIQTALDDYTRGDGVVHGLAKMGDTYFLPAGDIELDDTPIYVGGGVCLRGRGMTATRLIYEGISKTVRFKSYAVSGVHEGGGVLDLSINATDDEGDGIGIDEVTVTNALSYAHIERVCFNVKRTAINMRKTAGADSYFCDILGCVVQNATRNAVRWKGEGLTISGLKAYNRASVANGGFTESPNVAACLQLEGQWSVLESRLEGDWGGALLLGYGDGRFIGNYCETYREQVEMGTANTIPQVILDACSRVLVDRFMFVEPKQPVYLRNTSNCHLLTTPWAGTNGGGAGPAADVYKVETGSSLRFEGADVVTPAALPAYEDTPKLIT